MATIIGTEANNILLDPGGDDIVLGLGGDDVIDIYRSRTTPPETGICDGGAGIDRIILDKYHIFNTDFVIDLRDGGGGRDIDAGAGAYTLQNIERITFRPSGGSHNVTGGQYADILESGSGNDRLNGWQGDDTIRSNRFFQYGQEFDDLDGGTGIDTLVLQRNRGAVPGILTINIGDGGGGRDIGDGTRLTGFEKLRVSFELFSSQEIDVVGGAFDDDIVAGSGSDRISGGGGNDRIVSGAGRAELFGGDGNDYLGGSNYGVLERMAQILDGGAGTDVLSFTWSEEFAITIDLTDGGGGRDIGNGALLTSIESIEFRGGKEDDTVIGGALDDILDGVDGRDNFSGMGGDDQISVRTAAGGADRIEGGDGEDVLTLIVSGFAVVLDIGTGGGGADIGGGTTVAGVERINLHCGAFSDRATGGALADNIFGGNGNDRLVGAGGHDLMLGGAHKDFLDGGEGWDTLVGEWGNDTLHGGAGNDDLDGSEGSDRLFGEGGDDILKDSNIRDPGATAALVQLLDGGAGVDTASIFWGDTFTSLVVDISAGGGAADIGEGTILVNVEKLAVTSSFGDDHLTGGALDDHLDGALGANIIRGMAGNDFIRAGFRNNSPVRISDAPSLGGVNLIDGGDGVDFLAFNRERTVNAFVVDISRGGEGADIGDGSTISGIEQIAFFGSFFDDRLTGGALNDHLRGFTGNDVLEGGGGGDFLDGSVGFDCASYQHSAGVAVALDGTFRSTGDAVLDQLVSIERLTGSRTGADHLGGDGQSNRLVGGGGDDWLEGRDGNDTFLGGTGADILAGGGGRDYFDYTGLNHGGDLIEDFTSFLSGLSDRFRFLGSAFGALPIGALAANRFVANTTGLATTADHRFIYETDTGILRFDANGSVAGGVTVIATLTGAPALTVADVVII